MAKPALVIDLQSTNGNIHMVIAKARQLVPSEQLDSFIIAILDAQRANKSYDELLTIIGQYVNILDTSKLAKEEGSE